MQIGVLWITNASNALKVNTMKTRDSRRRLINPMSWFMKKERKYLKGHRRQVRLMDRDKRIKANSIFA